MMDPDSTEAGHADPGKQLPDPPADAPTRPAADPRPPAILTFPRRIRDNRDDPDKVVNG